jgi:hypothetical protein
VIHDDTTVLPEGTRVRTTALPLEKPRPFGERLWDRSGRLWAARIWKLFACLFAPRYSLVQW